MFIKIIFIAISLSVSIPASADIYKYTAPNGQVYYTDTPKSSRYKRVIRSRPKNYSQSLKNWSNNKKTYTPYIIAAASRHNIDPNLLHAVIHAESAYNPVALSTAGAVGLMQLMPATAKRFGVTNRKDPRQNIEGGTRYLKFLLKLFDSNMKLAVAAYNAGENAVKKYKNSVPPYPETQNYVKRVLSLYKKYAKA